MRLSFWTRPLGWSRYSIPNPARGGREWTPRRIAAAKRAVIRQKDATPLFPELARHQTVEDRIAAVDANYVDFCQRFRAFEAESWRRARRELRELPRVARMGVLFYWGICRCPGTPVYLLELLRSVRRGASAWRKVRKLVLLQKSSSRDCSANTSSQIASPLRRQSGTEGE